MKKAILIPANPNRVFRGGQDEGSIEAHENKIREAGSVFWRLIPRGNWVAGEFPHGQVKKGYLYDTSEKMVTHSCEISWIKPMSKLSFEEFRQFFLEEFKNRDHFEEVSELFYILNITKIRALARALPLQEFKLFSSGEPVKLARNYCIVQHPGY
jgi:hypothetical protein